MNGAGAGHPQLLDRGLEQLLSVHLKEQQKVLALEGERSAGGEWVDGGRMWVPEWAAGAG